MAKEEIVLIPGQEINPYRLFHGLFVSNWLARREEVSPAAKLLYGRLMQYAGKDGVAQAKTRELAREIGIKNRFQVLRLIRELKDHRLLRVVSGKGSGKGSEYHFLAHSWMNHAARTPYHLVIVEDDEEGNDYSEESNIYDEKSVQEGGVTQTHTPPSDKGGVLHQCHTPPVEFVTPGVTPAHTRCDSSVTPPLYGKQEFKDVESDVQSVKTVLPSTPSGTSSSAAPPEDGADREYSASKNIPESKSNPNGNPGNRDPLIALVQALSLENLDLAFRGDVLSRMEAALEKFGLPRMREVALQHIRDLRAHPKEARAEEILKLLPK